MADTKHAARGVAMVTLRLACEALEQANDQLALRLLLEAVADLKTAGVAEKGWDDVEKTAIE